MIGTDEIKPQRVYDYKDKVVVVLGITLTEKNSSKAVIYKDCLYDTDYSYVINLLEFCNHATLITNFAEIKATELEKSQVKLFEQNED